MMNHCSSVGQSKGVEQGVLLAQDDNVTWLGISLIGWLSCSLIGWNPVRCSQVVDPATELEIY
eukprot:m.220185 g.220185  ORF g.220185 m.220185 type:complete len:63 (-) comp54142_c0_seq50:452-640(-)